MTEYFVHQFRAESELRLPCDPQCRPSAGQASEPLRVRLGGLAQPAGTDQLASYFDDALGWYRHDEGFLLRARAWLRLLVHHTGRSITVDAPPDRYAEAAAYVIGMGMGLCSALQGYLSLHACSVEVDGRRIALLAPSGTGKSTTLWALLQAGARFANDDTVPARLDDGRPVAFPSISLYPKVSPELMGRYGIDSTGFERVYPSSDKLWYPVPAAQRAEGPARLTAVLALEPRAPDSDAPIRCDRKRVPEAVPVLMRNSLTALGSRPPLDTRSIMAHYAALAGKVPVYSLTYPKRLDVLPELAEAIRATAAGQPLTVSKTGVRCA